MKWAQEKNYWVNKLTAGAQAGEAIALRRAASQPLHCFN